MSLANAKGAVDPTLFTAGAHSELPPKNSLPRVT